MGQSQSCPAGAGTAFNLIACVKGDLRIATDCMWNGDLEHANKMIQNAVESLREAIIFNDRLNTKV